MFGVLTELRRYAAGVGRAADGRRELAVDVVWALHERFSRRVLSGGNTQHHQLSVAAKNRVGNAHGGPTRHYSCC